jgi:ABC-type multidrug transport system ATPase subunit
MIINEGRIVATGTPAELERRAMGADRLAITVSVGSGESGGAAAVRTALGAVPGVTAVETQQAPAGCAAFWVAHAFDDPQVVTRVSQALQRGGWPVQHFAHERLSLEDVFVALVRDAAGGDAASGDAARGEKASA